MTDDELIAIAERAGLKQVQRLHNCGSLVTPTAVMRRFADAVQAAERERCAELCWDRRGHFASEAAAPAFAELVRNGTAGADGV